MKQELNRNKLIVIFAIASIIIPLFYSLYTNNIWDDFFITFRFSKNLAEGHGLVYNLGQRVYGFTSPLGTLLPAFLYTLTGKYSYLPAIWLFRIISICAFSGAGILLLLSLPEKLPLAATFLLGMLYCFETKSVVFSTNGMETAFMLFFLAAFIFINYKNYLNRWVISGFCWAGLMYTRPDGCIYIIAFSLGNILFAQRPKKKILGLLLKMALVCAIIYLPWFIWTWSYYGNPIPHTILAKANLTRHLIPYKLIFTPIYSEFFTCWPQWMKILSILISVFSSFYWLLPLKERPLRIISFAIFILNIYLFSISTFPWYLPPTAMMSLLIFVNGSFTLMSLNKRIYVQLRLPAIALSSTMVAASIFMFVMTSMQMRIQQKEIEENRQQIGLWLKQNSRPQDVIYLESLGYIGYFSQAKIIDYPGLVSPRAVELLKKKKKFGFWKIVPEIRPDWIVLRPVEAKIMDNFYDLKNNYSLVKIFNVTDRLKKYNFVPCIDYLVYDAVFLVFKKI